MNNIFYNENCITGCKKYFRDNSIDLIITDPPYGIEGDELHRHYNRDEQFVVDGYVEVPESEYGEFSKQWITQAARILKPGGAIYIVSGYTNLYHILSALRKTELQEMNHIIWKYNFGVYTRKKFVSSHYHILYYVKPGADHTFHTYARFGPQEKDDNGGSLNYQDREDVWIINREYKPGRKKNKNTLPPELLRKMILYSSDEEDLVCDFFLGSFSTARTAIELGRYATGFEISEDIYSHYAPQISEISFGSQLENLRQPKVQIPSNQGEPWSDADKANLLEHYEKLIQQDLSKKEIVGMLMEEFGRGRFAIRKMLRNLSQ